MTIVEPYISPRHGAMTLAYEDADSFDALDPSLCTQTYGVCFCDGKLVIGFGGRKNDWGLIGGTIEPGETFEETLRREIVEEANMEIISCRPIGYQKVTKESDGSYFFQLRYACVVKPIGPFVADPAGGITKIALIDPKEYKTYFDWGQIGERLITRAHAMLIAGELAV